MVSVVLGSMPSRARQDIPAWPHTNCTPCTAGTYLYDCGREQGPLGILKGSHEGPIYSEYDEAGRWVGCLSRDDAAKIDMAKVVYLDGPAGSVTIHNCRADQPPAPGGTALDRRA